jgi:single-strand DNA-binding protein
MPTLNKTFLIGRLTRDPELKRTPSGTSLCEFSLAVNRYYKDKDGDRKEETSFFDVVIWGDRGDTFAEFTTKGSEVLVIGRLKQDRWTTEDNQSRSKVRIVCDEFQFLGKKNDQEKESSDTQSEFNDAGTVPF